MRSIWARGSWTRGTWMRGTWLLPVLAGALAPPVHAAERRSSPRLDALARCAAIPDAAARLACYDREVAVLRKAVDDRQVAVVEQSDIRKTQRELFGVAVPSVKLFDALGERDLDRLETTVAAAGHTGDGRLTFTTAEGSVWEETDDLPIYSVKPGRKVTLKRGALGSFFASFDKGASVRARRVR